MSPGVRMMPCLFYAAGFDITGTQNFIAYGKLRRRGAEIARSEVASEGTAEGSVRLSQS
jgi:hypothetical protein